MEKTKRQPTESALAAKMVRQELKQKFKGIKFKVTSENYSMGSSLNISWIDGPTEKEVDTIVQKYQYGSVNPMEDTYDMDNVKDFPQAKYVFTRREYSNDVLMQAFNDLKRTDKAYETCNELQDNLDCDIIQEYRSAKNDIILNYLSKCELSNGYETWMTLPEVYNSLGVVDYNSLEYVEY